MKKGCNAEKMNEVKAEMEFVIERNLAHGMASAG